MRSRLLQLDGLRGLAILIVIVWHYFAGPSGLADGPSPGRGPLAFAWSGVDLFFVLSGYLIGDILLRARTAQNYYAVFFVRRICRLIPLYVVALALFVICRAVWLTDPNLGAQFEAHGVPDVSFVTFVQNLYMASENSFGPAWLSVSWSLAVEWQFYLLFPLLVRYAPPRWVALVAVGGLILGPLIRSVLPPIAGYVSLVGRADAFLAGALVAYLLWNGTTLAWVRSRLRVLNFLWGVLLLGLGVMMARPEAFGAVTTWYGTFTHTWLALTFAMTVLLAVADEAWWLNRFLRFSPLRWVGTVSFGMYLFHQPVNHVLHAVVRGTSPNLYDKSGWGVTLLAILVTIGLASALYGAIETWFIGLGRRAKYRTAEPSFDGTNTPPPAKETIEMPVLK